jgi:DNA-binding CsgD family transcriptional regulator
MVCSARNVTTWMHVDTPEVRVGMYQPRFLTAPRRQRRCRDPTAAAAAKEGGRVHAGPDLGEVPSQDDTAEILRRLIPCERVELVGLDRDAPLAWRRCWEGTQKSAAPAVVVTPRIIEGNPVVARLLTMPTLACPLRSSDITAIGPLMRSARAMEPGTGECQLAIPLVVSSQMLLAWLLTRSRLDFDEADVVAAALLLRGLRDGIRDLLFSHSRLTVREQDVLELVAAGLTAAAIARRFRISVRTVHKHLENAYRKLGCANRVSAVLAAREAGFLAVPQPGLTESRASA